MKVYILTNTTIKKEWLDELAEYVDWDVKIDTTTSDLPAKQNIYFNQLWGDFDWLRKQVGVADIRCFCTTKDQLRASGITGHIGMYDLTDGDTKLDIYFGIPPKLDKRAKNNGFKYNFTWLMVHEYLHGEEQQSGTPDRVHDMEKQGRLKELLELHLERRRQLFTIKGLLEKLLNLLKRHPSQGLLPRVERQANIVVAEMARRGHPVRIVEGYRSKERQDELYAQGRTEPGAIVTNARGGESLHNYGVAVDFVFRKEGYNASPGLWQLLGTVGVENGFSWGGDWNTFVDKPHFEMTLNYSLYDFQVGNVDYKDYA